MKKSLLFLVIFFSFIGCGEKQTPHLKPKPLPSWYLTPLKSNTHYVYVTGSGIDKKEAILNALSNFIAQYSVTISSNFKSKSSDFGGGLVSKSIEYEIKSSIKKIEVSNYEVIKAKRYSFDKFLVLVRVDVDKLYKNLKLKLDNRFKNYQKEFSLILKEDPLKRVLDLEDLWNKLKKEKIYIYILKSMNSDFNEKRYLDFINRVKNNLDYFKKRLTIEIVTNYSIKEDIKKYLSSKGIKTGKSDLKLIVRVKKRDSSMGLVVYEVVMDLKYKGSIVSSNYFKIVLPKNRPLDGYFYDEIKDLSIRKFFNIIN